MAENPAVSGDRPAEGEHSPGKGGFRGFTNGYRKTSPPTLGER